MTLLDVDTLVAPLSGGEPCGPNLEYDREFGALETAAQGKPERQMGATVVPAEDPDWKVVRGQSEALLRRSKDLRVACHLAKSLLRLGGFAGLAEGLAVVRRLLEQHWDGLHPRLDPDDDNDPTMRVNTLGGLCDDRTVAAVRTATLVNAPPLGRFSLRDVAIASGELALPPGATEAAPDPAAIEAAFGAVDLGALAGTAQAVADAVAHLGAIETLVTEKVGVGRAADLSRLSAPLGQASKLLTARLEERQPAAAEGDGVGTNGQTGSARAGGGGLSGDIRSRDDVIRALDRIVAYYERHEPSSPIPILLKRCKRLVTMGFLDIVKDIAPEALAQVALIGGRPEGGEGSGG
jgi:type VI secretion system protein ImpA